MAGIRQQIAKYWPLIKSRQTALLVLTGVAGYLSARCPVMEFGVFSGLMLSLALSVSGSTIINMVYDRDIDAIMQRTCDRPLPAGRIKAQHAQLLGIGTLTAGLLIGLWLSPLYALMLALGAFFDVVIYTFWLKRLTPWSILWGGLSGGFPALAGRVLGIGTIDWVGIAFLLGVLFWIPTHIMTITMKYEKQYAQAGIPTFPRNYGHSYTRRLVALSNVFASIFLAAAAFGAGMTWGYMRLIFVLAALLFAAAFRGALRPSQKMNFRLFKLASVYMLMVMLIVSMTAFF